MKAFFASDLHGHHRRYEKLFESLRSEPPSALFLGGDLFPSSFRSSSRYPPVDNFVDEYLFPSLRSLKRMLGAAYPAIFLILGNDDRRSLEPACFEGEQEGLWTYLHMRVTTWTGRAVAGYSFVPPTPFRLKDWERYDVSRYVDPGCIAPEDGQRTVQVPESEIKYATIREDLEILFAEDEHRDLIALFHSPPYNTALDRAALDGQMIDHAPLDVHVGSIAIREFIVKKKPALTLHGHIHESPRITGKWKERLGETWCLSAAHDGPELALVSFDPEHPGEAERLLL